MPLLPHSQFSQKPGDGPPTFSSTLPGGRQLHSCELTRAALPGHRRTQDPSVRQGQGSRPRRKPQPS